MSLSAWRQQAFPPFMAIWTIVNQMGGIPENINTKITGDHSITYESMFQVPTTMDTTKTQQFNRPFCPYAAAQSQKSDQRSRDL